MSVAIAKWTLEDFSRKTAEGPAPAAVAVSAVSASFALSLLMMTLANAAKKNADSAAVERIHQLRAEAEKFSLQMMGYADGDLAAFDQYLKALRLSKNNPDERQRTVDDALHKATEIPLAVARLALSGLDLCAKAAPLTRRGVLADLGAAAALLEAAVRAVLGSAESNIAQMTAGSRSHYSVADRRRLLSEAAARAESVLNSCARRLSSKDQSSSI